MHEADDEVVRVYSGEPLARGLNLRTEPHLQDGSPAARCTPHVIYKNGFRILEATMMPTINSR